MIKNFNFKNWAESYSCQPDGYFEPRNESELRNILAEAKSLNRKIRVVGFGHSPSDLCCTSDYMVSMKNFDKIIRIDEKNSMVEVQGGISVETLINELKKYDLALDMVPTVMNLTLAGMISTASHNTGYDYPITTAFVTQMTLMKENGSMITCSRDENSDVFYATGAGLGALAIIINLTLQCVPMYHLKMTQSSATFDTVIESFIDIAKSSDHTRMYYIPHTDKITIHRINRIKPSHVNHPYSWFWDHIIGFVILQFMYLLSVLYTPLVKLINRIYQKILYNHSFVIHDSYENIFTFDIKFRQYVSEWAIPIDSTGKALIKLKHMIQKSNFPAHLPVEIRFAKSDSFLLSPAYGRDSAFINIIAYRPFGVEPNHQNYWAAYAHLMTSLNGRPHLAKDHSLISETMRKVFPKFDEFRSIRKRLDPDNVFVNDYIERVVGI